MGNADTDRITKLAEQNRENIAAIAKQHSVERRLTDDVDGGSLADVMLDPAAAKGASGELTREERALALVEQNAENIATLATRLDVRAHRVDRSASGVSRSPGLAKALGIPIDGGKQESAESGTGTAALADELRL